MARRGKQVGATEGPCAVFDLQFIEDLRYWQEKDTRVAKKAFDLIAATLRDPFTGLGKPEPLKYMLQGCWSRHLTEEHRIVYLVEGDKVTFLMARYHYER